MLNSISVYNQIKTLTTDLIRTGLCDAQNFPSIKTYPGNIKEIGINGEQSTIFLKSIPYFDMFLQLSEKNSFNIKMLDGALISMQYRFKNDVLIAHRLSFYPAPNLEAFQNEPDIYLQDEIYNDIMDKRIVTIPIRFDFDNDTKTCKPISHPISHLTLGQYKNCRIPVSTALTPFQFLSFIIMIFYNTAHKKYFYEFTHFKECFNQTIYDEEKKVMHISTPVF